MMLAVLSLLLVVTLSLLVTRIATVALTLTGLSREAAAFQARSAFTGTGFTTSESESITNHPVRRRIVMFLMFLGNLGIASVVATSILTYLNMSTLKYGWVGIPLLIAGLGILWFLATNQAVEKWLNLLILRGLKKWTKLKVQDYVAILHLHNDYAVSEMMVEEKDWLAGKTLIESSLSSEGILVLGVQRQGGLYLGAPRGECRIEAGDTLVLYGQIPQLEELDRRRQGVRGEKAHEKAVVKFEEVLDEEQILDEERLEE